MTRISNVDQILILLEAHLERLQRQKRAGASKTEPRRDQGESSLDRVARLASAEGLSDLDTGRALVSALLTQEFGAKAGADLAFHALVERVTKAILADPDSAPLLRQALAQMSGR